jgi:hypothetical protein
MRNTGSELIENTDSAPTYIQCDSGQVGWPDGTRWVYEESPSKTSETVSNKIGR